MVTPYIVVDTVTFIPYSMDGFKVVKLEDVSHFVDIVITCTGREQRFTISFSAYVPLYRRKAQYHKETFRQVKKWLHNRQHGPLCSGNRLGKMTDVAIL